LNTLTLPPQFLMKDMFICQYKCCPLIINTTVSLIYWSFPLPWPSDLSSNSPSPLSSVALTSFWVFSNFRITPGEMIRSLRSKMSPIDFWACASAQIFPWFYVIYLIYKWPWPKMIKLAWIQITSRPGYMTHWRRSWRAALEVRPKMIAG